MSSFDSLPLIPPLQSALTRLGYSTMTPIQSAALPPLLEGRNAIVQAATGSGKTLPFALTLLNAVDPKRAAPQGLVLCPTRELAEQVSNVIRSLASEIGNVKVLTLCGGVPMKGQIHSLQHGAQIIVGTPGRILKLLQIGSLNLERCPSAVLDEADRMVDMGFIEDVEAIFAYLPQPRQTLLISATYPESIRFLAARLIDDPVMIRDDAPQSIPSIREIAYRIDTKCEGLISLLGALSLSNAIIFCNTKIAVSEVCALLNRAGIHAIELHGGMEQFERDEAIIQFRNGSAPLLVATDVAGRGLDIEGLDAVINYDVPTQGERYVHRIGRTGRAGVDGVAITLVDAEEVPLFLELGRPIPLEPFPETPQSVLRPAPMRTICIDAGRKEKLRAGDIVGALIHEARLSKEEIGKIDQLDHLSYVAIAREKAGAAYQTLLHRPIKGRNFRLWLLD